MRRSSNSLPPSSTVLARSPARSADWRSRWRSASRNVVAASGLTETQRKTLDDQLVRLEQTLLDESEPSDKRWYRHVVYGWNIYSLYDGQPLPGVAYAQRTGDAARVSDEVRRLTAALTRMRDAPRLRARGVEVSAAAGPAADQSRPAVRRASTLVVCASLRMSLGGSAFGYRLSAKDRDGRIGHRRRPTRPPSANQGP